MDLQVALLCNLTANNSMSDSLFLLRVRKVGAARRLRPGIEVCLLRFQLFVSEIKCWLAEQKAQRCVFGLDGLDDRLGGTDGIAGLIAAARFRLRAALAGGLLIIGKPRLRLLDRTAGPVGAERSGFDDQHLDAER